MATTTYEIDCAKGVATLALTSKTPHATVLLKEVIDYCFTQLEHRMSNAELLEFTETLRAPYAWEAA